MRDRVMGVENEFGMLLEDTKATSPNCRYSPGRSPLLRIVPPRGIKYLFASDNEYLWLSNGACMYFDRGSHPEFASAECRRVRDLVIQSRAGEILAAKIFGGIRAGQYRIHLFKNNVAKSSGTLYGGTASYATFGCHENYFTFGIDLAEGNVLDTLIPFSLTRQILDGTGQWAAEDTFVLSQRALTVNEIRPASFGPGFSPNNIPLIHTIKSGRRYHHVSGDANMLDVALFLKFGTMHLVLSLIESGATPKFAYCTNTLEAVRKIAHKGALDKTVKFSNGDFLSALEVQSICWEAARKYLKKTSFGSDASEEEAYQIHNLWGDGLNAIASSNTEWMLGRLDYATKKYLTENVFCKNKDSTHAMSKPSSLTAGHNTPRQSNAGDNPASKNARHPKGLGKQDFDILYHCISDQTVRSFMDQQWPDRRLSTDEEVEYALRNPPHDTQARLRAKFISSVPKQKKRMLNELNIWWDTLEFYLSGWRGSIHIANPLQYHSREFELLLRRLKRKLETA